LGANLNREAYASRQFTMQLRPGLSFDTHQVGAEQKDYAQQNGFQQK